MQKGVYMQDLLESLEKVRKDLDTVMKSLRPNGNDWARKTKAYNVAKYETAMRMREEGLPVTLIEQVIKGHPDVCDRLLDRDIAFVM